MTVVNIKVKVPGNGGNQAARGVLQWVPTGRRIGPDGTLILPVGFSVQLVNGAASVDVEPSDASWAWRVTEQFAGQHARTSYYSVPETGPVNYTDLVPLDPVTLDVGVTVTPDPDNPGLYLIGA